MYGGRNQSQLKVEIDNSHSTVNSFVSYFDQPGIFLSMTLLDIFEAVAQKLPSSAALIQEDGKIFSYRTVDGIASLLGEELACAIAVAPVDEGRDETPLVAVMMTRGIGLVTAILGILKAGAGNGRFPL